LNIRRNWHGYLRASDEKPQVNRSLLKRVASYAKPYRWRILGSLIAILLYTVLGLSTPLILRALIKRIFSV